MATPTSNVLLTGRDLDILAALDRCPLTAEQMHALSWTFALPFTSERRVRERLQQLGAAGRVRRWHYATAGRGALGYYTLSPLGFQILHGDSERYAPKRAFAPVGLARQHHTYCLAEFIVHLAIATHQAGWKLTGFYRENACRLPVGDEVIYPDCAFQLVAEGRPPHSFFVELDNSTEVIRSDADRDSWQRKLRLYDAFQDSVPDRFRVIVLATRSSERIQHILDAARDVVRNPQRTLIYGGTLRDFLARPDALVAPCFRDHAGRRRAIVWHARPVLTDSKNDPCEPAPAPCYAVPPVVASATPA